MSWLVGALMYRNAIALMEAFNGCWGDSHINIFF
jgi:hypothetical protein